MTPPSKDNSPKKGETKIKVKIKNDDFVDYFSKEQQPSYEVSRERTKEDMRKTSEFFNMRNPKFSPRERSNVESSPGRIAEENPFSRLTNHQDSSKKISNNDSILNSGKKKSRLEKQKQGTTMTLMDPRKTSGSLLNKTS